VRGELVKYDSTTGLKKDDLFNLYKYRGKKDLLIVEGYPDALYLPTLGIENVVAVGQGLLSKKHIEGLRAFNIKSVTIAFDNDPPKKDGVITGVENTEKAIDLLKKEGIETFVIDPPLLGRHKDPDAFVTTEVKGVEKFKALVDQAESVPRWLVKQMRARHNLETDRGRENFIEEALELDASLPAHRAREGEDIIKAVVGATGYSIEGLLAQRQGIEERKNREEEQKAYQDYCRKGLRLIEGGDIVGAREYLTGTLPELRGKAVTGIIEPLSPDRYLEKLRAKPEGLKTGYKGLDNRIKIRPGAITLVAGRTAHGKTTFLMNLLVNMIDGYKEKDFFFFTYEEPGENIVTKLINIFSGHVIDDERRNFDEIESYMKGCGTERPPIPEIEKGWAKDKELFNDKRLWIADEHFFVGDLTNNIYRLQEQHQVGAVFVDYIQKIKTPYKNLQRQVELQKVSEQLLETAKDLNIPIVLGVQLGRAQGQKDRYKVRLDNLRESGDLEQDANLVLGLLNYAQATTEALEEGERIGEEPREGIRVTIMKNRDGEVDNQMGVMFLFNAPILTLKEETRWV
jgi:hypothetical protein